MYVLSAFPQKSFPQGAWPDRAWPGKVVTRGGGKYTPLQWHELSGTYVSNRLEFLKRDDEEILRIIKKFCETN